MILFIAFYFYFVATAYSSLSAIVFIYFLSFLLFPGFCFLRFLFLCFSVWSLSFGLETFCTHVLIPVVCSYLIVGYWEIIWQLPEKAINYWASWKGDQVGTQLLHRWKPSVSIDRLFFWASQWISLGKISSLPSGGINLTARILRPE